MRLSQLSPQIGNFQTGCVPESVILGIDKNADIEGHVAITLKSCSRRVLLRYILYGLPEDVPEVIPCDLRVQQLLRKEGSSSCGKNVEAVERDHGSFHYSKKGDSLWLLDEQDKPCYNDDCQERFDKLNPLLNKGRKETQGGDEDEGNAENAAGSSSNHNQDDDGDRMSHEDRRTDILSRRSSGRNDYSEIDLARHVTEMGHMMSGGDGGGGDTAVTTSSSGSGEGLELADEYFPLEQLPSTVRFNDALACTSKDIQILKSGAIKMMRLTVICHSDLHYQNNTQKHHQNHPATNSTQSRFANRTTTTAAEKTIPLCETSSTTKLYSSSSSTAEKVSEEERDVGKYERESSTAPTLDFEPGNPFCGRGGRKKSETILKYLSSDSSSSLSSATTTAHHHSHHDDKDEHRFTPSFSATDQGELAESFLSTTEGESSKNWGCLKEKIRSVFQAHNIHVGEGTIVSLKSCPLSSFQSKFSPAVLFVFVEKCEMRTTSAQSQQRAPDIGRVTGKTEIFITNVHHISYYHRLLEKDRSTKETHLYGLESAAKILSSMFEMLEQGKGQKESVARRTCSVNVSSNWLTEFSHGLLISGPSGCGKVAVVREIAKKVGAHLLSFNPVGSVENNVSQFCQQLSKIFMSALMTASRYPTVLLLPRIHLLFQRSSSPSANKAFPSTSLQSSRERVLHHLCKLFDSIPARLALSVVGTTDKAFLVPLQLRRAGRLEKEIIISPPKELDRLKILQELVHGLPQFRGVLLEQIASQTPGYVAQDLQKLVRLTLFKCQEEDCSRVTEHHVRYSIGRVVPSVLEGALGVVDIQRAISLDHIAGLHSVKLDLIKAIVWPLKHPLSFLRMGISPPKGILLYGPPGNCKTTLVRAVAASHKTNFLSVSAAELFSSGVGDSEKIVAHLFHRARMASPCILFIDELEAIVGSRQNSEKRQTSTNESILSMLLTEMDGVGTSKFEASRSNDGISGAETLSLGPLVLVVAATNRPDLIDPALLRPGRFDKLIGVPPLDESGRKELLEFCAKSIPFHSDVNFSDVAALTEYYSGADLVNLCKEAAMFALSEDMSAPFVTSSHVKTALSTVGPSLNPKMVRAFHEYGSSRKS